MDFSLQHDSHKVNLTVFSLTFSHLQHWALCARLHSNITSLSKTVNRLRTKGLPLLSSLPQYSTLRFGNHRLPISWSTNAAFGEQHSGHASLISSLCGPEQTEISLYVSVDRHRPPIVLFLTHSLNVNMSNLTFRSWLRCWVRWWSNFVCPATVAPAGKRNAQ